MTIVTLNTFVLDCTIAVTARHRTLGFERLPAESTISITLFVIIEGLCRVATVTVRHDNFRVEFNTRRFSYLLPLTQCATIAPVLHLPNVLLLRCLMIIVAVVVVVIVVVVMIGVGYLICQNDLLSVGSCVREFDYVIIDRWRQ